MNKKLSLISAVSLISLAVTLSASAAMVRTGEKYSLEADKAIGENLYVASGDANVAGNVHGDLTVAGGNIIVTGENSRDVLLVGGSVAVLGPVSDDLRLLGGDLIVGKNVGGDLTALGGKIHLLPEAYVSGEFLAVGGDITLDGTVAKDFAAAGGNVTINGKVLGNVRIRNVRNLTIGEGASIKGNLEYASANDAIVADGAKIGGKTVHNPAPNWKMNSSENRSWMSRGNGGLWDMLSFVLDLMKLVAYLSAVLILVHHFGSHMHSSAERMRANFWPETLRGFLVTVFAPVLMFVMAITIIGFVPAFFVGLLFLGLWILAKLQASIFLGAWLFGRFSKAKMFVVNWKSAVLGTLCFLVLKEIPIFGWAAAAVLILASFGELSNQVYGKAREMLSR